MAFIWPMHLAIMALWYDNHGGWSFGSRHWLDALPSLLWTLVPVVQFLVMFGGTANSTLVPATTAVPSKSGKATAPVPAKVPFSESVPQASCALALIGPESCSATGLVRLARGVGLLGGLGLVWALYVQHLGMTGFSPRYWNALACYEVRCAASEAAAARFGNTSLAVCPCGAKHRTVPPFAHA